MSSIDQAAPPAHAPPSETSWCGRRVARLAFLIGAGCDSREIAADPLIAASPAAVRTQACRLGLKFRPSRPPLPPSVLIRYARAAEKRGVSKPELFHQILLQAGSDDALIDNILDDI